MLKQRKVVLKLGFPFFLIVFNLVLKDIIIEISSEKDDLELSSY